MLVGKYLLFPVAVYAVTRGVFMQPLPMIAQIALTLLIVVPMGPFVYRLAYEPIAEASTLLLLIVSVAVHFAMVGLGLVMFGAEGSRTTAFSDATFQHRQRVDLRAERLGDRCRCGADRRAVLYFDRYDFRQGVARDLGEPARRAAGRHRHDAGGTARVHARGRSRRAVRRFSSRR